VGPTYSAPENCHARVALRLFCDTPAPILRSRIRITGLYDRMVRVHIDTDLGVDTDDACALAFLLGWPK
jgi:hypothetical protein